MQPLAAFFSVTLFSDELTYDSCIQEPLLKSERIGLSASSCLSSLSLWCSLMLQLSFYLPSSRKKHSLWLPFSASLFSNDSR